MCLDLTHDQRRQRAPLAGGGRGAVFCRRGRAIPKGRKMAVGVFVATSLAVATCVIAELSGPGVSSGGVFGAQLAAGTFAFPAPLAPGPLAPAPAWFRWSTMEKRWAGSVDLTVAPDCTVSSVSYSQGPAAMLVGYAPPWLRVTTGESITGRCATSPARRRGLSEWPFPILGISSV